MPKRRARKNYHQRRATAVLAISAVFVVVFLTSIIYEFIISAGVLKTSSLTSIPENKSSSPEKKSSSFSEITSLRATLDPLQVFSKAVDAGDPSTRGDSSSAGVDSSSHEVPHPTAHETEATPAVRETSPAVECPAHEVTHRTACLDIPKPKSTRSRAASDPFNPSYVHEQFLYFANSTGCNDSLLGISAHELQDVFKQKATPSMRKDIIKKLPFDDLRRRGRSYFIAAVMRNSQGVFPHWAAEVIKVLFTLAESEHMGNLFVSVYESGSADLTAHYVEVFASVLRSLGVRNSMVVRGVERRPWQNRIDFLSSVRNLAMQPFFDSWPKRFDRVIWLSDNYFCGHGLLEQVFLLEKPEHGGVGADAGCGLDFGMMGSKCAFYDRWATHDLDGKMFKNGIEPDIESKQPQFKDTGRWASTSDSQAALNEGRPFHVFSCWCGAAVYRGELFHKEGLIFRRSRRPGLENESYTSECPAAETQLIYHDMWHLGYNRVVITPNSRSAYTQRDFDLCVKGHQTSIQIGVPVRYQNFALPQVECCPIDEYDDKVWWDRCKMQEWQKLYTVEGIPRHCWFAHLAANVEGALPSVCAWPPDFCPGKDMLKFTDDCDSDGIPDVQCLEKDKKGDRSFLASASCCQQAVAHRSECKAAKSAFDIQVLTGT